MPRVLQNLCCVSHVLTEKQIFSVSPLCSTAITTTLMQATVISHPTQLPGIYSCSPMFILYTIDTLIFKNTVVMPGDESELRLRHFNQPIVITKPAPSPHPLVGTVDVFSTLCSGMQLYGTSHLPMPTNPPHLPPNNSPCKHLTTFKFFPCRNSGITKVKM